MVIESESRRNFPRTPEHIAALVGAAEIALAHPDARAFVITDVDEVRDRTRKPLADEVYRRMCLLDPERAYDIPLPDIALREGIRRTWGDFFSYETYVRIWQEIEDTDNFFKHVEPVDPLLPQRLAEFQDAGFVPILQLTARGVGLTEITRKEGVKQGLPEELPVYAMYPGEKDITDMKMEVLRDLAKFIGKPIIMIDDNPDLIFAIQNENNPLLIGILYETEKAVDGPIQRRGTWATMLDVVQRVFGVEQAA